MVTSVTASPVKTFSLLVLILVPLLIHGCGFQLRGSLGLSEDISPLYLQQNSARELARELQRLLAQNKVVVADKETGSNSRLTLLSENKNRRILSVDGDGRAREYLLIYRVDVLIKIRQAKEVKDTVSLSRSLLFDPEAVLAFNNQADLLYKEMQKNAAHLILLKLQSRSNMSAVPDDNVPVDNAEPGKPAIPDSTRGETDTQ